MPRINCPECKEKISDKALACTKCCYPLQQAQQEKTLTDILTGKRWQASSQTHGFKEIILMRNDKFIGLLIAGYATPAQQVNATWQAFESQLFLDYPYTMQADTGWTMEEIPLHAHTQIQFSQISDIRLLGVDGNARAWELHRFE